MSNYTLEETVRGQQMLISILLRILEKQNPGLRDGIVAGLGDGLQGLVKTAGTKNQRRATAYAQELASS